MTAFGGNNEMSASDIGGDTRPEVIEAGEWRLRAMVPDAGFSLAVEADDATAEAEHTAFADRCLPPGAPAQARDQILALLRAARQILASSGIGYLSVLLAEVDGRPRCCCSASPPPR